MTDLLPSIYAKITAGLAALAALAFLVWALVLHPETLVRRAAEARGAQVVAEAQAGAAQDTLHIVVDNQHATDRITQRTVETTHEILTAPGAAATVDPALHRAGLRALCLQDGRREPVCADVLRGDGPGSGAGQAH